MSRVFSPPPGGLDLSSTTPATSPATLRPILRPRIAVLLAGLMLAGLLAGPASLAHPGVHDPDTRHADAANNRDQAASRMAPYVAGEWNTVVVNPATLLPEHDVSREHGAQGSVRARLDGWLWDDLNGDGYIGGPSALALAAWGAGAWHSPNDGVCVGAFPCELVGRADVFAGKTVQALPPPGGWPPGAAVLRPDGPPLPLAGSAPASLRTDPAGCVSGRHVCFTYDVLEVTGLAAPAGQIPGGILLAWTEGATAYTHSAAPTWLDPPASAAPPEPTPAYPFNAVMTRALPSDPIQVVLTDPNLCTVSFPAPETVTVDCVSPPGAWRCAAQALVLTATFGTVSATQGCGTGPTLSASATAPGRDFDAAPGFWDMPWFCTADFTASAGEVECYQPDP